MNDWVHCNKCSMKYNPNIKLFLTECGHLFCQRCTENLKDSKCSLCDKSVKIIPISNDMDASIQQFFIPFETQLKKTIEVYNFQMQHRARLLQTTLQKYKFAKNECITAFNKYREATKENKVLKSMLMAGGKTSNPHPFATSTPLVNASQADGMSMSSIGFTPSVRDGVPVGFSSGPGIAQRMQSRNVNVRGPYLPPHLNSGGSSLARSSTVQLVPNMERKLNIAAVHRSSGSAFSMEQLRRAAKRT